MTIIYPLTTLTLRVTCTFIKIFLFPRNLLFYAPNFIPESCLFTIQSESIEFEIPYLVLHESKLTLDLAVLVSDLNKEKEGSTEFTVPFNILREDIGRYNTKTALLFSTRQVKTYYRVCNPFYCLAKYSPLCNCIQTSRLCFDNFDCRYFPNIRFYLNKMKASFFFC